MTACDVAVAVALGSIIGRTATTPQPSYVRGVAAVVVLLANHHLLSVLRTRSSLVARLTDRPAVELIRDGQVTGPAFAGGTTEADLHMVLREHGISDPARAKLVVLEARGAFSVAPKATRQRWRSHLRLTRLRAPPSDGGGDVAQVRQALGEVAQELAGSRVVLHRQPSLGDCPVDGDLVRREPDEHDRLQVWLTATPGGLDLVGAVTAARRNRLGRILRQVPAPRCAELLRAFAGFQYGCGRGSRTDVGTGRGPLRHGA